MPRVEIRMPEKITFTAHLAERIGDIRRSTHLGNDAMISYLNDALIQRIKSKGFKDLTFDGIVYIINDLAVIYKSESFKKVAKIPARFRESFC